MASRRFADPTCALRPPPYSSHPDLRLNLLSSVTSVPSYTGIVHSSYAMVPRQSSRLLIMAVHLGAYFPV